MRRRCTCGAGAGPVPVCEHDDACPAYGAGIQYVPGMTRWVLVTERPLGPGESRVERCVLRLRDEDALTIAVALRMGTLRPRPGVRAWVSGSR